MIGNALLLSKRALRSTSRGRLVHSTGSASLSFRCKASYHPCLQGLLDPRTWDLLSTVRPDCARGASHQQEKCNTKTIRICNILQPVQGPPCRLPSGTVRLLQILDSVCLHVYINLCCSLEHNCAEPSVATTRSAASLQQPCVLKSACQASATALAWRGCKRPVNAANRCLPAICCNGRPNDHFAACSILHLKRPACLWHKQHSHNARTGPQLRTHGQPTNPSPAGQKQDCTRGHM